MPNREEIFTSTFSLDSSLGIFIYQSSNRSRLLVLFICNLGHLLIYSVQELAMEHFSHLSSSSFILPSEYKKENFLILILISRYKYSTD